MRGNRGDAQAPGQNEHNKMEIVTYKKVPSVGPL